MFQVSSKIIHNMLNSFALGYGFKSMYVSYLANTLLVINKKSGRIRIIALLYSIVFYLRSPEKHGHSSLNIHRYRF